ncbi:hypothetical protein CALCODRAFT_489122 [Calocera cornea HHB12733]|uniref:Uncharacterized protein n=1 Tax=Calocera cornea HHB12733 TaxID=1353952 RepID=A0A166JMG3_9BASI|nr:hypothetical protein CALCODRAFT_489122 [Calocera cornea HHB12733]
MASLLQKSGRDSADGWMARAVRRAEERGVGLGETVWLNKGGVQVTVIVVGILVVRRLGVVGRLGVVVEKIHVNIVGVGHDEQVVGEKEMAGDSASDAKAAKGKAKAKKIVPSTQDIKSVNFAEELKKYKLGEGYWVMPDPRNKQEPCNTFERELGRDADLNNINALVASFKNGMRRFEYPMFALTKRSNIRNADEIANNVVNPLNADTYIEVEFEDITAVKNSAGQHRQIAAHMTYEQCMKEFELYQHIFGSKDEDVWWIVHVFDEC